MNDYKTCPLKAMGGFSYEAEDPARVEVPIGICTKSGCAWWYNEMKCCAMIALASDAKGNALLRSF